MYISCEENDYEQYIFPLLPTHIFLSYCISLSTLPTHTHQIPHPSLSLSTAATTTVNPQFPTTIDRPRVVLRYNRITQSNKTQSLYTDIYFADLLKSQPTNLIKPNLKPTVVCGSDLILLQNNRNDITAVCFIDLVRQLWFRRSFSVVQPKRRSPLGRSRPPVAMAATAASRGSAPSHPIERSRRWEMMPANSSPPHFWATWRR